MNIEIEQEILDILSRNQEEFRHAKDTLNWLLRMSPNSDFILRISALSHDIERTVYGKDEREYDSYEQFKIAHSKRSSEIVRNILFKHNMNEKDIQRVKDIILNHEFGGNDEANLVKDADSLANFQWVDRMFGKLEEDSLRSTMRRMFGRIEEKNKKFYKQLKFKHLEVKNWLSELEEL